MTTPNLMSLETTEMCDVMVTHQVPGQLHHNVEPKEDLSGGNYLR